MNLHEYQKRLTNFIAQHPRCIISVDMGLGKTAAVLACIQEKRNFIGFETDPEFYAKACRRIEEARKNLTLF